MTKAVEVKVGKKSYRFQVDEGQENRVKHVAEMWDGYVTKLMAAAPNMERDQMLVLAGVMMGDDFLTTRQEKETHEQSTEAFHNTLADRLEKLVK